MYNLCSSSNILRTSNCEKKNCHTLSPTAFQLLMSNKLPVHHHRYYFTHGSHILKVSRMLFHWDLLKYHLHKVEDTLYKLFGELLTNDSVVFKQMLISGPDRCHAPNRFGTVNMEDNVNIKQS